MNVVSPFVAHFESSEAVEPSKGALNDPAIASKGLAAVDSTGGLHGGQCEARCPPRAVARGTAPSRSPCPRGACEAENEVHRVGPCERLEWHPGSALPSASRVD